MEERTAIPDTPAPDEPSSAGEHRDSTPEAELSKPGPTLTRSIPAQIGRGLLLGFVLYLLWLMIQLFL